MSEVRRGEVKQALDLVEPETAALTNSWRAHHRDTPKTQEGGARTTELVAVTADFHSDGRGCQNLARPSS